MSIISVAETFDQQRGATVNDQYQRTYERVFLVVTDGTDGPQAVRNASGIPLLYTYYAFATGTGAAEADVMALCRNIRSEQQGDSPRHWKVYCSYDSTYNQQGDDSDNPLNLPAVISCNGVTYSISKFNDINGKAMKNSAGDLFDPPPQIDKGRLSFKVHKNLSTDVWSPDSTTDHQNRVNSATYLGFPANSLKCQGASASEQEMQGVVYWSVEYEFLYDPDKWIPLQILDQGYRHKVVVKGVAGQEYNTDSVGGPATIRCLDGAGGVIADPSNAGTQPKFIDFTVYNTVDFNSIGLIP